MTALEASEKLSKPDATSKTKKPFKLNLQQKNWILSFHIGFAALWTGTVLSMFLIALRNKNTTDADILFALNSVINLLDDVVVIPAAIGSVITATLLCWQTNYGFFKFYWVITKWILTTGLMIFGTFWLFPWGNAAEEISLTEGLNTFKNSVYWFDTREVLIGSLIQVSLLLVIITISTLKPWGRRLIKPKNQLPAGQHLKQSPWWMAIVFAVSTLTLGMLAAGWGYSLNRGYEQVVINPPVYPPDWFFWAIWLILYPLLGISTWIVWCHRQIPPARTALIIFTIHFLVNLSWVPVVHVTRSTLVVPVVMDIFVDGFALVTAISYWRVSKLAFYWLIPYLAWNVFTTFIKIWRLLLNVN